MADIPPKLLAEDEQGSPVREPVASASPTAAASPAAGSQPGDEPEPAEDDDALLQACANCGTTLDVSDLEPFAKVHCPSCGTAIRARTQLKNFTLVELLGSGGMGAVYKALDSKLDRMVALKVVKKEFSSDAEYLAKFEHEAVVTASVNHPHVVKVYSFGSDHGLFYIAMELVDKGSLDDLMNLQGRVAEIQALNVGIQMAQGLQAAHQKGLIHRDVKPGNILFADAQTAKIVDFGLALLAEHAAAAQGEVWGTPYYVAPEKLDHQPEDFRSDMYSLGATLFHAIAGRPPFEADTASMVALKHLKSKAVSLQAFAPDVSSATAYVINRTLNKDPEQRYQSYAEMIEHLEYAKAQLTQSSAGPRRPRQRVVVQGARQQKAAGIINLAMIVILVLVVAGLYIFRDQVFGTRRGTAAGTTMDPEAASQQLHQLFDVARNQIVAGDYNDALDTLKKLDDSDVITQPLQNWVTLNQALIYLLEDKDDDAHTQFNKVNERGHFSNDSADAKLVSFFLNVAGEMSTNDPISVREGNDYSLDSFEALGPLLFGFKDWSLGKFGDAGSLFGLYLVSTPAPPYDWVADYKPIAQKYAAAVATYDKVAAAVAAADTPEKKAAALKQVQDLEAKVHGTMTAGLKSLEDQLNGKTPSPSPAATAPETAAEQQQEQEQQAAEQKRLAEQKVHDEQILSGARTAYANAVAGNDFDAAKAAVDAAVVTNPDVLQEKEGLEKKADWLKQFKAELLQLINTYDYPNSLSNSQGSQLPQGRKHANDSAIYVQTQFGTVSLPFNTFPVSTILAIANYYTGKMATASPQQAADLQWLSGVFAYEEGSPDDGRKLLLQAASTKPDYKKDVVLFPETDSQ